MKTKAPKYVERRCYLMDDNFKFCGQLGKIAINPIPFAMLPPEDRRRVQHDIGACITSKLEEDHKKGLHKRPETKKRS